MDSQPAVQKQDEISITAKCTEEKQETPNSKTNTDNTPNQSETYLSPDEVYANLDSIPYEIISLNTHSTTSKTKGGPIKQQEITTLKMIVIGNSGVGKSCLMHRVTTNQSNEDHEVTIGVEFGTLMFKMGEQDHFFKV